MAPSSASQSQWWFARTTQEECQLPGGCALEVNLTASPGCPSVQLGDAFMPHAVSALRGPGGLCARAARGTVAGAACLRAREGGGCTLRPGSCLLEALIRQLVATKSPLLVTCLPGLTPRIYVYCLSLQAMEPRHEYPSRRS